MAGCRAVVRSAAGPRVARVAGATQADASSAMQDSMPVDAGVASTCRRAKGGSAGRGPSNAASRDPTLREDTTKPQGGEMPERDWNSEPLLHDFQ